VAIAAPVKPRTQGQTASTIPSTAFAHSSHHLRWARDIEEAHGHRISDPPIGDTDHEVAKLCDMLHPNASGSIGGHSAADKAAVRSPIVIGPDKRVKLTITLPLSSGRNIEEVLRLLDSVRLTAAHDVATAAN
jgi:alkyl hydroperoxide reductase subunit AhpC